MARIFVGNLPMDVRDKDVEDIFYKYGRIRDVDLKTPLRPPAFAFVAFEDIRDAKDAVRGRDGYDYEGNRLRVEIARSWKERAGFQGGGPPRGEIYYLKDLKDHMRKAGDVLYADVDRRGGGIVHYSNRSDMEYALKKMDDSEFRNAFDRSFIRVSLPRSSSRRDSRSPRRDSYSPRRQKRYSSSRSRSSSPRRSRKTRSYSKSTYSSGSRDRSRSREPEDTKRYSRSPSRNESVGKSDEEAEKRFSSPLDEK